MLYSGYEMDISIDQTVIQATTGIKKTRSYLPSMDEAKSFVYRSAACIPKLAMIAAVSPLAPIFLIAWACYFFNSGSVD